MIMGSRLREARKNLNYTQKDIAEELGISDSAISLYENEKRNPNLETVLELVYLLGVSADYLLGTEVIVKVKDEKEPHFAALTKDEVAFINEIRKDKMRYEALFTNYKRGVEIIKKIL